MQAPPPPTTGTTPAHICTDERCAAICAERDELRVALRVIRATADESLHPSSSTAAA